MEVRYIVEDSMSVLASPSIELMGLKDWSAAWSVRDVTGWLKSDFVEEMGITVLGGVVSVLVSCSRGG